jgi:hypothetical protein
VIQERCFEEVDRLAILEKRNNKISISLGRRAVENLKKAVPIEKLKKSKLIKSGSEKLIIPKMVRTG